VRVAGPDHEPPGSRGASGGSKRRQRGRDARDDAEGGKKAREKRSRRQASSSSSESEERGARHGKRKKKRRAASPTSSSEDSDPSSSGAASGAGSSSSSSSGGDATGRKRRGKKSDEEAKWALLNDIWPIETRPKKLQDKRYVNRQSWRTLHALQDRYEKEAERKGFGAAIFGKDQKLKKSSFKKKTDDGYTRLHPARWQRLPMAPPDKYWDAVPRAHEQRFRHLQLGHYGAESQINEKVILSLHDRQVRPTLNI
jgi:hypothetical protein